MMPDIRIGENEMKLEVSFDEAFWFVWPTNRKEFLFITLLTSRYDP